MKYQIVEIGEIIYIIGPRDGHTWNGRKDTWEICRIDNADMWDEPGVEEMDRANARAICSALNETRR